MDMAFKSSTSGGYASVPYFGCYALMKNIFRIALFLVASTSYAAPDIKVPEGFVLQHLESTDGSIARPKDWFYTSNGTQSGWLWTLSKEDPNKGSYKTGLRIQLLLGVGEKSGMSRGAFVQSFIDNKKSSTKVIKDCQISDIHDFHRKCLEVIETIEVSGEKVEFHILYSLMWGKDLDMVVVSIFGAPSGDWESVVSTANVMSEFVIIGPEFGKTK